MYSPTLLEETSIISHGRMDTSPNLNGSYPWGGMKRVAERTRKGRYAVKVPLPIVYVMKSRIWDWASIKIFPYNLKRIRVQQLKTLLWNEIITVHNLDTQDSTQRRLWEHWHLHMEHATPSPQRPLATARTQLKHVGRITSFFSVCELKIFWILAEDLSTVIAISLVEDDLHLLDDDDHQISNSGSHDDKPDEQCDVRRAS